MDRSAGRGAEIGRAGRWLALLSPLARRLGVAGEKEGAHWRGRTAGAQRSLGGRLPAHSAWQTCGTESSVQRQPHIVFRQAGHGSSRTGDVIKFRQLTPLIEG